SETLFSPPTSREHPPPPPSVLSFPSPVAPLRCCLYLLLGRDLFLLENREALHMRAVMDLETENRIAAMLLREAAELRRQAEKEGVRAYLEKPTVRARPNSRFLTATVLGVQQAVPVIVIVVSVVSCILVLIVGGAIGGYIWKHRYIEKKRRGSQDVQKMVKTLNDSSLNFKYSTLEKATGCFDEANKLGQGGFGSVYKILIMSKTLQGVLADGREIAVKRPEVRWPEFQLQISLISNHSSILQIGSLAASISTIATEADVRPSSLPAPASLPSPTSLPKSYCRRCLPRSTTAAPAPSL
ncbi:unnamed protein product, partial [Linum tenue]